MNPHHLLDRLDDALVRLQRGEDYAAIHILQRLQDQAKDEAIEMDRWNDRYAEAQDVTAEYKFD